MPRLDLKQRGLDQTDKAGLKKFQSYRKVFDALLGVYPADHKLHTWLAVEIVK